VPSEIWTSLDMNVHRMFARMDVFRSAGLGSNRGLLLAGPLGTGKTVACRILAAELLGTATPIFVESKVGEYVLHQLYEELSGLGPALVLLEDLDLLAGSRDEQTQRSALFDFLTILDGLMTQHHEVVTVATTNDPRRSMRRFGARHDSTRWCRSHSRMPTGGRGSSACTSMRSSTMSTRLSWPTRPRG
jgi:DNA polymerase III delta prime subunit